MPWSVLGPMARTVADTALLLQAQMDDDRRDPFSHLVDPRLFSSVDGLDLGAIHAAITPDLGCCPVDKGIADTFKARTDAFRGVFAEAQDRAPDMGDIHRVFEIFRGITFVAMHQERLKNHKDLLGPNVIDNTTRGLEITASDVGWALVEQARIMRNFIDLFDEVDVLICPAASVSPFPHEQLYVDEINGEKMPTYMRWLAISYAPTMAMACSAVIPCGVDHKGMPFGLQVMAPNGKDALVLAVAHALEQYFADKADLMRPVPDLAKLKA
tara:strand:- start:340 stop:1149 length:810 start_codon:yes stop_codon:yes gene_type:complete